VNPALLTAFIRRCTRAANIRRMAYIGFPLDIAAQRASGPENRRTTGGMAYRVSRTNTPDLQELRRDIDQEREAAKAQGRKGSAHVEHRHGLADEHACWHDLMHHFLHISPLCPPVPCCATDRIHHHIRHRGELTR